MVNLLVPLPDGTKISVTELQRPKRYNASQLAQAGVEVLDLINVHLRCVQCGATWSPDLLTGARLPRGYWKCPNGCNAK